MTPPPESRIQRALAFKAYEIEELADIYFFRPLGALIARAARLARLTPSQVTIVGAVIGVAAGALLYDERLGLLAFALLVLHSIVDSADGQLARMTGQVTELGRILDGVGGYMTHAAIYVAIVAGFLHHGGNPSIIVAALLSAIANSVHAQLYDYFRSSYIGIAVKGTVPGSVVRLAPPRWAGVVLRFYESMQQRLIGLHGEVEAEIAARSAHGRVSDADRARYRACFYWPVRGWNFLGDNTRIYAIGALASIHRLEWFFAVVLVPMNAALVLLTIWQRRADRRFLGSAVVG